MCRLQDTECVNTRVCETSGNVLLVRNSLYTIVFMVGLSIIIFVNERSFVRPSDCIWEQLKKGTFTAVQLWAVECWVPEFGFQKLWAVL